MNFLQKLFGSEPAADLKALISNGAFLVDVRTAEEFRSGSVKGAVNIPLASLGNELDKFRNKQNIIVFCRSGARSGQAKAFLQQHGFTHVVNGGAWDSVNKFVQL
jgi:phage shock protein E